MKAAVETFPWPPVFDPQTWENLLAVHQAKHDFFSVKTLGTILDGIQHLALARLEPTCPFVVTGFILRSSKGCRAPSVILLSSSPSG
jgi:hypothetical protein